MGRFSGITKLHAFPRPEAHLTQKTASGAIVTLLGLATIFALFVHELAFFLTPLIVHKMAVDSTPRGQKLDIVLDITFPSLPCQLLSLDSLDMSGKHEVDVHTNMVKMRLDKDGREIQGEVIRDLKEHKPEHTGHPKLNGSDHEHHSHAGGGGEGAVQAFMQQLFFQNVDMTKVEETVSSIKESLAAKEGCRIHGHLVVERVAGNFHVSVHGQSFFILQRVFGSVGEVNVSHVINTVGFGAVYPGIVKPLDGFVRILPDASSTFNGKKEPKSGIFKYFLKVVPTDYTFASGKKLATNQYSVTEYFSEVDSRSNTLPAVYFLYDLSPIVVNITENQRNFFHFLSRLCAVLGGTFALTGMLDRWVYFLVKNLASSPQHRRIP